MTFSNIALVALPKQDLIRPPAALPVLAGVCESVGANHSIWDFNVWLRQQCDDQLWNTIDSNWIKIDSYAAETQSWYQRFTSLLDQYIDLIIKSEPDLIAISVFTTWSSHAAFAMITQIRQKSNIPILIGGSGIITKLAFANQQPLCEYLLQNKLIDYYIHGEGEIALAQLLTGNTEAPGINNTNSVQIDDLDSLPLPCFRNIDISQYEYRGNRSLTINGSRGCVRACSYCDVSRYWPKYRYKSGNRIADEIFYTWKTTGINSFEFSDSLVNGSIREFRKMNRRLIELSTEYPNFKIVYKGQFICRSAVQFKEADYRDMQAAGCDYLYVGVETFSESVRMSMDKKFDNAALDFHLRMCAKYGIPNVFLMIVGYPTETAHDHKLNLDGLKKYQHYAQAGIIEMITFGFTTTILEYTPLHSQREALNIVSEFEDFENTSNWVSLNNPSLNYMERVRRWVELTELADSLGYQQPRLDGLVGRLQQMIELTKTKSINPCIKIQPIL